MINHKHKFIFIHIPRTGGTSIEQQFSYDGDRSGDGKKHWNLDQYKEALSNEQFDNYFKFTFIRNPWDIVISKYMDRGWYSSPIQGRGGEIGYYSGQKLSYFLNHYQPARHEYGDSFFDYFNPKQIDFVGRFEDRRKGLNFISKKIGINLNPQTKTRSNSDKKHYTQYYDDETREIVAKKYARDIEYFGYKFGE